MSRLAQETAEELQKDFDDFMMGQIELNEWETIAIVAGHDAHCHHSCGDDISTYSKLTKRERFIVQRLWEKFGNEKG